jgi:MFS family permease
MQHSVTCFLGDWIAGTYGRKWSLRLGAVLIIIGALVNAFAKNFDSRFITILE